MKWSDAISSLVVAGNNHLQIIDKQQSDYNNGFYLLMAGVKVNLSEILRGFKKEEKKENYF